MHYISTLRAPGIQIIHNHENRQQLLDQSSATWALRLTNG